MCKIAASLMFIASLPGSNSVCYYGVGCACCFCFPPPYSAPPSPVATQLLEIIYLAYRTASPKYLLIVRDECGRSSHMLSFMLPRGRMETLEGSRKKITRSMADMGLPSGYADSSTHVLVNSGRHDLVASRLPPSPF